MTPSRKRMRVVWLVFNQEDGIKYGGEWEYRKKDAMKHLKDTPVPIRVVRAEIVEERRERRRR